MKVLHHKIWVCTGVDECKEGEKCTHGINHKRDKSCTIKYPCPTLNNKLVTCKGGIKH